MANKAAERLMNRLKNHSMLTAVDVAAKWNDAFEGSGPTSIEELASCPEMRDSKSTVVWSLSFSSSL